MKRQMFTAEYIYARPSKPVTPLAPVSRPVAKTQGMHRSPWIIELLVGVDTLDSFRDREKSSRIRKVAKINRVKPAHRDFDVTDLED